MARVSFSQYSMWSSCPQQYKLSYIDGLSQSTSNIHSVFGSAMHETLQEYLSRCLRISKSQADKNMDTKEFLKEKSHATKQTIQYFRSLTSANNNQSKNIKII